MIELPRLMIGEGLPRLLELHAQLTDDGAKAIECNASQLMTADPVGICLLAAAFHRLTSRGQRPRIVALRPEVYGYLRSCDVLSRWLDEPKGAEQNPTRSLFLDPQVLAQMVSTQTESNRVANALTKAISRFLPDEDAVGVHSEEAGVARYLRIEQPVSYLMTELLDNALNHARAALAAQARGSLVSTSHLGT